MATGAMLLRMAKEEEAEIEEWEGGRRGKRAFIWSIALWMSSWVASVRRER